MSIIGIATQEKIIPTDLGKSKLFTRRLIYCRGH
jgi:hypothetical protein